MRGKKSKRIDPPERKEPIGGARRSRKYVKPEIISSSAEELLDELGTARACSFDHPPMEYLRYEEVSKE